MSHEVRIYRQGGPSVLTYGPADVGDPGAGQLRLRQRAVGVNFVDTMFRSGFYAWGDFPFVLGLEAAGTVDAVGPGVSGWAAGDRAAYWSALGAYSDDRIVGADDVVPIPGDISDDHAAAVLTKGLLAWALTHQVHRLEPGQTAAVAPAAGGVGLLTALWATALGARVIGVTGSAAKAGALHAAGLKDVIVTAPSLDLAQAVGKLTGPGRGVDVVYDGVGGPVFAQLTQTVKPGGSAVSFGNASNAEAPGSSAAETLGARQVSFAVPQLGEYVRAGAAARGGALAVFGALRSGVFGEPACTVYPLREVAQAHRDLEGRRTVGSLVLRA